MRSRARAPGKAEVDNREATMVKGVMEDVTHRPIIRLAQLAKVHGDGVKDSGRHGAYNFSGWVNRVHHHFCDELRNSLANNALDARNESMPHHSLQVQYVFALPPSYMTSHAQNNHIRL